MDRKKYKKLKNQRDLLLFCLIISVVACFLLYQRQYTQQPVSSITNAAAIRPTSSYVTAEPIQKMHIVGGFSANTPDAIVNASDNGIKDIFYYGNPPAKNSAQGLMLQALGMKMVDGFIASNLYYYECQRGRAMILPPTGLSAYCGQSTNPTFASEDAFLATIAAHLKQAQNNDLIIGYWVLDDWASWDPGGARQLLIKVHGIIQKYTPGRPAICGFGGTLAANHGFGWNDGVADNFSPQGCDEVGLYIYASSMSAASGPSTSETYDWSMAVILPDMFASLQKREWNITREPLIGIVQAFGGPITNTGRSQVTPTAEEIEIQSRSFCEHGATGLTFYGWSDSWFGPETQTPMSSSVIETGIKNGVAVCTEYWNKHLG